MVVIRTITPARLKHAQSSVQKIYPITLKLKVNIWLNLNRSLSKVYRNEA